MTMIEVTEARKRINASVNAVADAIAVINGPSFAAFGVGATGSASALGNAFVDCLKEIAEQSKDSVEPSLLIDRWTDAITDIMALHAALRQPDYKHRKGV